MSERIENRRMNVCFIECVDFEVRMSFPRTCLGAGPKCLKQSATLGEFFLTYDAVSEELFLQILIIAVG